jgi:hypothetical protein
MYVSPGFIPPEQREQVRIQKPQPTLVVSEYTTLDYVKDALAAVLLMGTIFVMIWIAFALDVITTGM